MDLLKNSVKILKNLQLPNGGILATLKNGAYPYVYTRDGVFVTKALNRTGNVNLSEKFYYFMKRAVKIDDYKEIFQRYTPSGKPSVTRKNQNDNEGLLLHGIYDTYLHNQKETFIQNMWLTIDKTVDLIFSYSRSGLVRADCSIHEYKKLEKGYDIWVNSVCCRGLKDAAKIAEILNHKDKAREWNKKADTILRNINKKLFDKKRGFYIKNRRFPNSPDISQLAPFYFEIVDNKKILKKTLGYLRKHIWDEEVGGFKRFRKFEVCDDWHWYTGGSGSWCALTAMASRFYKKAGMRKEAKICLDWLEKVASFSKGNLPEHVATEEEFHDWKVNEIEFNNRILNETKRTEKKVIKINGLDMIYWANPLGWSHAEYVLLKKG